MWRFGNANWQLDTADLSMKDWRWCRPSPREWLMEQKHWLFCMDKHCQKCTRDVSWPSTCYLCFFVITMICDLWHMRQSICSSSLLGGKAKNELVQERSVRQDTALRLSDSSGHVRRGSQNVTDPFSDPDFEMRIPLWSLAVDEFEWLKNCLLLFPLTRLASFFSS